MFQRRATRSIYGRLTFLGACGLVVLACSMLPTESQFHSAGRPPAEVKGLPPDALQAPAPRYASAPLQFALASVHAAASASPVGFRFSGYVEIKSITAHCERPVYFSRTQLVLGSGPQTAEEPSVAVLKGSVCVPLESPAPLALSPGRRVPLSPVPIGEFEIGEEYTSADPADLIGAGASLFIPGVHRGSLIGIFAVAGFLERPDGTNRTAVSAVGLSVQRVEEALREHRYPLWLRSPAGTPVGVVLSAAVNPL